MPRPILAPPTAALRLLACCVALAVATPAQAAAPAAKRWKLAVLDVKATGKVDPAAVEGLSALVASECAVRADINVTSGADLRAMIGFEKQKEALGCSDASCLAEIGGALGVDYIVASEVSQVGGTWLVSLSLVNIARATSVARLTKRAQSEQQLVDTAIVGVRELLLALPAAAAPVAAAPPPAPVPAPTPAPAPAPAPVAATEAAAPEGPSYALPVVLVSAGLLAAGAGGYFFGTAWVTHGEFERGQSGAPTVSRTDAEGAAGDAQLGVGLLSAGVALIGASAILWPAEEDSGDELTLAPAPGGATARLVFSLP